MKKRLLVLLTALVLGLTTTAAPVFAGSNGGGGGGGENDGKKRLCVKHFTSSEANPYNFLYLPKKAALKHKANHDDVIKRGVDSRAECKALDDTPKVRR